MLILTIGGIGNCGQDVLGEYFKKHLLSSGYKPCIIRLNDPKYAYTQNNIDWDQMASPFIKDLVHQMNDAILHEGTSSRRFKYLAIDRLFEDIEFLRQYYNVFIVDDIKCPYEFEQIWLKYTDDNGDEASRILVDPDRKYKPSPSYDKSGYSISEDDLIFCECDYIVHQKNLEDLEESALAIIKNIEAYASL